jgi:hypothetical protein
MVTDKRDRERESWNERAVRCVLNHLIPDMKSYPGHATDKLIFLNMARHAHPGGCGVTVGKYTQADHLGCSDRRVWDAVKRLRRDGWIERTAQRTAERGSDTYRIKLCQRCRVNTAGWTCQRCSPPPAATAPSGPSAVSSRHPNRELQGERSGTPVIPDSRPPTASPNGDGRAGAVPPAPEHPSRVGGLPPTELEHPHEQLAFGRQSDPAEPEWQAAQAWNGTGMATLLRFPADPTSRPAAAGGTA